MAEFKPTDLYVGVVELFSVLLPGALLTAALVLLAHQWVGNPFHPLLETPDTQWVAFGFVSYALGAFVFPVASLLDEGLYDAYRARHWTKAKDEAFQLATQLRVKFFGQTGDGSDDKPMNTFAWAKSLLMLRAGAAYGDVQRYEAESKFFRSLVIVVPVAGALLIAAWWQAQPVLAWLALLLSGPIAWLSFHRYAERRHKSTEWAYRYVLTLQLGPPPPAA